MNKVYCSSCGKKNEFTVEKPKFCSSCGDPFSKIAEAKVTPKTSEDPNEEQDDEYYNPQEVKARAKDLARSISEDDFLGEFSKLGLVNKNKPIKLRDWTNQPKGDNS